MTVEEALLILETGLAQGRLTRIQELVFRQAWEGRSYSEMAENYGYDAGYIKNVASQLWRTLSRTLGEKVTKSNIQSVLKRRPYPIPVLATIPVRHPCTNNEFKGNVFQTTVNALEAQATTISRHQDWGEAIDTSLFYGRTEELSTLRKWIVNDHCRLIALLGMGGIGKTALSVKLAQQIEHQFEYVIWRSIRHAPPVQDLLANLLQSLDKEDRSSGSENSNYQLSRLIKLLRKQRCLLILDNVESIFCKEDLLGRESSHGNSIASHYALRRDGYPHYYEGYGELFKQIGEVSHQSCLVLTSREIPKEIAILQGETRPVRSLQLRGLGLEAKELLKTKGLISSEDELKKLIERYEGNPLALMVVSETIKEVFNKDIPSFFKHHPIVFGEINELLKQQLYHLSQVEKEVLYWLAINRVPIPLTTLSNSILSSKSKQMLTETLGSLNRRSLIKINTSKEAVLFTLPPLVMEYLTIRLIQEISEEILNINVNLLNNHALIQMQANDFVKTLQVSYVVKPILDTLMDKLEKKKLEDKLKQVLSTLRGKIPLYPGYAAENILNLLCELQPNLGNYKFASLTVLQADLQNKNSPTIKFINSHNG